MAQSQSKKLAESLELQGERDITVGDWINIIKKKANADDLNDLRVLKANKHDVEL